MVVFSLPFIHFSLPSLIDVVAITFIRLQRFSFTLSLHFTSTKNRTEDNDGRVFFPFIQIVTRK